MTENEAVRRSRGADWPEGVPRSMLIRYTSPETPRLLAEIAAAEDRSQHKVAQRALAIGLRALSQPD